MSNNERYRSRWYTGYTDPFRSVEANPEKQYLDMAESNSDRLVEFYDPHPDYALPYEMSTLPEKILMIVRDLEGKRMPLKEAVKILSEQTKKAYLNDRHKQVITASSRYRYIALLSICGYSVSHYTLIKYRYL